MPHEEINPAPSRPPSIFFTWEAVIQQYNLSMHPERTPPPVDEAHLAEQRRIYEETRK